MRYEEIKSYVENPLENLGWTEADKPFAFLCACEEIVNWLKHGDDAICHLVPASDGSCSGLQHFSAMLRDENTARRVNVIPSEEPQDIYKSVADFTLDSIVRLSDVNAVEWKASLSRNIVKRPTMTTPYGVSARGIEDQITEEVIKQASVGKIERFTEGSVAASKYLAPIVSHAINRSAKSARQCMEWFQQCSLVFSKNNLSISWETPSGMFCLQDNRKVKGETVNFIHKGKRERLTINKPTKSIDPKKQKSSIAPNIVHSFDAAHMCMTVIRAREEGIEMFSMIHDSMGCPANQAGLLNEVLRDEFVKLYEGEPLRDLYEYWLKQLPEEQRPNLPPPPEQGNMDLALVKQSLYFFA